MADNAMSTSVVSVTTTVGGTQIVGEVRRRAALRIFNNHASEKLFVGPSAATAANGFPVVSQARWRSTPTRTSS